MELAYNLYGATDIEPCYLFSDGTTESVPELGIDLEEADVRMLPLALNKKKSFKNRFVIK